MIFGAGALAVLLACAGTAAGRRWVVDDGGEDFTSIQAAVYAMKRGRCDSRLRADECPIMWA
ncbi:MAG: hypothetical protein C5S48_05980 [Candidatus Methanogaster sp.]|nr:MAG: hypothetical protein C5S48_05980 [ANME-2 cluster archaeon]